MTKLKKIILSNNSRYIDQVDSNFINLTALVL